jgi:TRAP-type mannitol/chloroaromatic compound transport system permease small subunit
MRKILKLIDSINELTGSLSSWLIIVMIAVILYEVTARYVFNAPTGWAFGDMRMLGGAIIVLGWAYAQLYNSHIRVDVFYTQLSARKQAFIDIAGSLLFFFPLFGTLTWVVIYNMAKKGVINKMLTLHFWYSPSNLYNILVVIGLCLTCLQFFAQLARDIHTLVKGNQYD